MTTHHREGFAPTDDGAEVSWTSHGEGPALLLLSGQGSTHRGWLHVVPTLAERHRVVLYDHRGVGRSTMGDRGRYTTRSFALDALAVLDAVGVERADVYGHSMGGRVAQWLAIDHPGRVDRLVLASTTGGDRLYAERDPAANRALASGDAGRMAPFFFTEPFRGSFPDVVDDFFARDSSISVRRAHFEASRGHDAWDDLQRIAAPTLVLHGADDPVTQAASARELAQRIPHAELQLIPGQLHCPHLESAAAQDLVEAFLHADTK
ncbi:alpha/beta fold hydrolase [Gulosibacter sp. ACHW.36C]|uniref:Alpha/beta hydrolase n=1 Tax=Gulosibacter sediminis TaxID=1729695 RepID=A0ABY4N454_9MICO|nr:alpha/beta fold hydrolase [Gulosibacter sediminis]UQN16003.1 alpha/beta hydrolase [Gulosibacter sediminis]